MLKNHRRTLLYALGLLLATSLVFVGVGRHAPSTAPATTFPTIGRLDRSTLDAVDRARSPVLTSIARALNVLGGGVVTIPLRAVVALWLATRRRWRAFATWVATWAGAEILLQLAKSFFHRGRPPDPLVVIAGYSFPSGHAVAAAATAVVLVLVLMPPGTRRRKWEVAAVAFASVMASSRVYLNAHWLSDVVAGVLLGTGVALGMAALVTEIRDLALRRRIRPPSRSSDRGAAVSG